MISQNDTRKRKPTWLKVFLVGSCLLLSLIILIVAIPFGYYIYGTQTNSIAFIHNVSGSDVRFQKVTLDDQILWGESGIIVSSKDLKEPGRDTRRHRVMLDFRAPKKFVELQLVILNEMEETESVSCTLDNRSRPCFFEVFYHKDRLICGNCGKDFMH